MAMCDYVPRDVASSIARYHLRTWITEGRVAIDDQTERMDSEFTESMGTACDL